MSDAEHRSLCETIERYFDLTERFAATPVRLQLVALHARAVVRPVRVVANLTARSVHCTLVEI